MKAPPRLSDPSSDAPDLLRLLLRAGQTDVPDAARMRALSARLGPLVGGGAAGAAGGGGHAMAGGAAKGAGAAAAFKVGAGLMLAVAVGGGAVLGLQRAPRPTSEVPVPGISAPSATPVLLEPSTSATAPEPAVPSVALPVVVVASTRTPARLPSAVAETAGISAASPASAPAPSAESEIALLQAAQAALRGNPTSALALADRHAVRFPTGALAQEREVIAIEALVALGRREEANERGARFARDFPDSAHRPRIEALLRGPDHNP
jgi:hypothetical protein